MKHLKNWKPSKRVDGKEGRSNQDRADMAYEAMQHYLKMKGEYHRQDDPGDVTDLMADLLHYAASIGMQPVQQTETALIHFESER